MPNILFHNHLIDPKLKSKTLLRNFIKELFKEERKSFFQLDFIFCSDEYLLGINQQSLNHDYYTDIITFDLSITNDDIIGEIYISVDRVADNATQHKVSYNNELHRVILHGILHLCGYSDKSQKEIALMRQMEDYYLGQYFNNK